MTMDPPHARVAPPAVLASGTPAAVLAALPGARGVGGVARDALAGLPLHDVDVAAPLPPETIVARLRDAGLRVFPTGLAHGTVTAVQDGQSVEVTSLRRDVATDGRHAAVEWTTDWREDAARRDFTINAMSLAADGGLWDYFDGAADLRAGRVRFVGDPATRLREDYLRALRFFRFQARYGAGAPDPGAVAAIRDAVPGLARLSAERVWMELKRLLAAPDPTAALALMAETGVLGAVLPEAHQPRLDVLRRLVSIGAPADPLLRLMALLPPGSDHRATAERLRWSNEEADRAAGLSDRHRVPAPGATRAAVTIWRAMAAMTGADPIAPLWLADAEDGLDRHAERAAANGDAPRFPLLGRDALQAGVPPGPHVGQLLGAVERWWLDEGCEPDRAACLGKLRQLAADPPR